VYDLGWAGRRWNVAILFRKSYCTTGQAHKHFSSTCVVCCPELKLPSLKRRGPRRWLRPGAGRAEMKVPPHGLTRATTARVRVLDCRVGRHR
jgi:hypothetical protein